MNAPDDAQDAEFWSQVDPDQEKKTIAAGSQTEESVDDFFNKASNEDIYAFSQVASSDEGVSAYLKNTEPSVEDAEGDSNMMANFMGDLSKKSTSIQQEDVDRLRSSMGLKK